MARFGSSVRAPSGDLDRRALGRIVFSDPRKLEELERIIHPLVRDEVARQRTALEASGARPRFTT
ncbi:MAG: dephospho-CoA kinase, partial [Calothrix sp. SM1_5_4]|nr:dephospho-CoA kinase [Calothrix sp. SM1_5_4]